ncbi:GH25 family lysozyme [Leifsonia shinshuensis]
MKTGLAVLAAAILTAVAVVPAVPATAAEAPAAAASATPSPTPSPSGSSTSTPAPSPSATPSASPSAGPQAPAGDPSLTEMNAARNHTMGSTIPSSDPASGSGSTSTFKASLAVSGVLGQDVSGWQTGVNWPAQYAAGSRFAYIKASEGTYYTSSQFASQYNGSYAAGLIRGAYHFATPNTTDGATQARFFYANGGGWSPDGRTLPPLLDIEYATDGSGTCWGLTTGQMTQWISDFVNTLRSLTGVNPAIYSTANWWNQCTGSSNTFGAYPLFVARYGTSTPGALPASWVDWTMWQFADAGTFAGDQDIFNGTQTQLIQFALGAQNHPPIGVYDGTTLTSGTSFSVAGWAFDQTNLAATVQVQITWSTPGGVSTTTVAANGSRPDVGAAYPGVGNAHGFTASIPWSGNGQYGACVTALAIPGDQAGNADLGCKTSFFSPASATAPTAERLAGSDRFGTAVLVSQHAFPNPGVPVAYVASGLDFPDALAASAAAAKQHGPVLLSQASVVPAATITELQRLQPAKIVLVGGPNAITDSAMAQLTALGVPVVRIGGVDRYDTSRLVASYAFPSANGAYVAAGTGFVDALSAAPVAAKSGRPLILVAGGQLEAGTSAYLTGHSLTNVTIVGGTFVISPGWQSQATAAGLTVNRIGGGDRFGTNALLVESAFGANSAPNVYLASGANWVDALVAGAAAGSTAHPLLLANTWCVPRVIGDEFVRLGTSSMEIAGGVNALTSDVASLGVCF